MTYEACAWAVRAHICHAELNTAACREQCVLGAPQAVSPIYGALKEYGSDIQVGSLY